MSAPIVRQTLPEILALAVVVVAVGVVVLGRRSRRAADLATAATGPCFGRPVLVAVAHPASADGLGGLAAAVARADRGQVEALSVIDEGSAATVSALAEETVARCSTAVVDGGAEATRRVRVDASVGQGILHRTVELDASLVVLGWPEAGEAGISSDIAPAITDSPAPLLLARLQGYRWERIRLCAPSSVADEGLRASLRLATDVCDRIADACDVPVTRHAPMTEDSVPGTSAAGLAYELNIVPVAPDLGAVRHAIRHAPPLGDLILALCHGPHAREHRPLLASAERLYEVAASSPSN